MLKEINVSHHQKKKLIKAIQNEAILFVDDNGDVIINVKAYKDLVVDTATDPLHTIAGIEPVGTDIEYLVIQ